MTTPAHQSAPTNHSGPPPIIVPDGFKLHSENSASILLPDAADAFLNPVQEFNRDLSVAFIRTWGEDQNARRKEKWETKQKGKNPGKRRADDAFDDRSAKRARGESSRPKTEQ